MGTDGVGGASRSNGIESERVGVQDKASAERGERRPDTDLASNGASRSDKRSHQGFPHQHPPFQVPVLWGARAAVRTPWLQPYVKAGVSLLHISKSLILNPWAISISMSFCSIWNPLGPVQFQTCFRPKGPLAVNKIVGCKHSASVSYVTKGNGQTDGFGASTHHRRLQYAMVIRRW
jgi:hypothetical protein